MTVQTQLRDALTTAMKSGDDQRKTTLRMALAAVKNAEIETRGELDDGKVLSILNKEVNARQETIDGAKKANRPDLVSKAEEEIAILNEFLPAQLTKDELREVVQLSIDEAGASSIADMGRVMGILMPKIQGRADGKEANQIVRELLGAG